MINKTFSLPLLALICSPTIHASVLNGDFEQWSGNTPSQWTVIDSGITTAPSSTQLYSGGIAAQVSVNTTTQGNTDLLQTVKVEQGKTYPFSVAVYHTEGGVKARLIVDGYQGYSNENKTDQWQTINHQYVASVDKEIQVGLRFYDVNGFDGSELVYVDAFQPNTSATTPPTSSCQSHSVTLSLTTDQYAAETRWQLLNSESQSIATGDSYQNTTRYTESFCLPDGEYTFTIFDSYGDGICCGSGDGSYQLSTPQQLLASGGEFQSSQSTTFKLGQTVPDETDNYYDSAQNKTGYELKTALHEIIKDHNSRGYSAIWQLVKQADIDKYYEQDGSILDVYSEKPETQDSVNFAAVTNQCGQYRNEGDCYNREHSFPKSWFGGKVEPMNSDGHHLYATDGFVNSKRSNWPFGEVGSASYISSNGSKLGSAASTLGYQGTVFEPIDEFKGDFARAYFYMATRYEDVIAGWEGNSANSDAVLDGTKTRVFEPWLLTMLKRWHHADPVSQKERDRNQAVFDFQGNRNPFIDHPEYVTQIWGE
ncbi:endonuclease I [Vibrio sp. JPW-9-11-11]|uniref:endonuclease n=1 Tax=Vibrio sp. JPW-9-11-11 TaxID=1416532 RepID=UPI001594AC29|nr:endonuclease [Vibrio sp. JPW-9-11-11]NVD06843.1 endonuclease I [Vibrio sp. JPW-9-11-11]